MILYNNMLQSLFESQISTAGASIFVLGIMFLILFRNIKMVLIALVTNLIPISLVFGIMGWLKIPLDIMTITIAAIALGIAVLMILFILCIDLILSTNKVMETIKYQ